jgi:hypothetical protein
MSTNEEMFTNEEMYRIKYLKYKEKYFKLRKQIEGGGPKVAKTTTWVSDLGLRKLRNLNPLVSATGDLKFKEIFGYMHTAAHNVYELTVKIQKELAKLNGYNSTTTSLTLGDPDKIEAVETINEISGLFSILVSDKILIQLAKWNGIIGKIDNEGWKKLSKNPVHIRTLSILTEQN